KRIVHENGKQAIKILAIMMEGSRSYSKIGLVDAFFNRVCKWKVKRRCREIRQMITPSELLNLTMIILQLSNTRDFINSIRLMSANRTTSPKNRVEQQD